MAKIPLTSSPRPSAPQQPAGGGFKKKSFDPVPDDTTLNVEVVTVSVEPLPPWKLEKARNGETDQVSFRFRVLDGPYAKRQFFGNTSTWFDAENPKCRLRIWVQEILGVDRLPDGFELDTDEFTSLPCRIIVGAYEGRDGETKNFVKDVLRAVKKYDEYESF